VDANAESPRVQADIDFFEAGPVAGPGMPYSAAGANVEHIANVSSNEIPNLGESVEAWLEQEPAIAARFNIVRDEKAPYRVLPRLALGLYLQAQFNRLRRRGEAAGMRIRVFCDSTIGDIQDDAVTGTVRLVMKGAPLETPYDVVIISTGHVWPREEEGKYSGYFNSPYPPRKLAGIINQTVAIRGSSLTAIDAVRTLARQNGAFQRMTPHELRYKPHKNADDFKIALHSRHALLPAVRFHLDDPHLSKQHLAPKATLEQHRHENGGFIALDYVFENDFKKPLQKKDSALYAHIKDMTMEEFVDAMMARREEVEPFTYLQWEYEAALSSIHRRQSIHWKELLAILSFAMNYPAKYFSAEDMQRLQETLMPLISIVIAFLPQSSCEELLALHAAGRLSIIAAGDDSRLTPQEDGGIIYEIPAADGTLAQHRYGVFIDCTGQRPMAFEDFPFSSLRDAGKISPAYLRSSNAPEDAPRQVPGIAIADSFRVIGQDGKANPRLYVMAVPFISGYNPDYSGLDFCEEASSIIAADILTDPASAPL